MSLPGPSAEGESAGGSYTEDSKEDDTCFSEDAMNAPVDVSEAGEDAGEDVPPLPFSEDDEYNYEDPEEE